MTDDIDDTMTAAECERDLLSWWRSLSPTVREDVWDFLTYDQCEMIEADEAKGESRCDGSGRLFGSPPSCFTSI